MLKLIRTRLHQGYKTSTYPSQPLKLHQHFKGLPVINKDCNKNIAIKCAELCPQEAISAKNYTIDLGKCVFCGVCEKVSNGQFIHFTNCFEMAATRREDLVISDSVQFASTQNMEMANRLFGRSVQLRQVSAGGCNACEADTNVLNTPFFDLARFGIQFVASPRHADGIHVTGPVTKNMREALLRTYDAVPSPKIVIAAGCCAISGGTFRDSSEITPLESILPVDLYIPGCPPHPMTNLHAFLSFFK